MHRKSVRLYLFLFLLLALLLWLGLSSQPDKQWIESGKLLNQPYLLAADVPDSVQALYCSLHQVPFKPGDRQAFNLLSQPSPLTIGWTVMRDITLTVAQRRFLVLSGVRGTGVTKQARCAAFLLAGSNDRVLQIDCAPQFDIEYHKKYIGQEDAQGRFYPGELLRFWERCRQNPLLRYAVVLDNFNELNPKTFFGPQLWEALSSPRDTAVLGGMQVVVPPNFFMLSTTDLEPGSQVQFNEEHFKRLGSQYIIEPNAQELVAWLRNQARSMEASNFLSHDDSIRLVALRDTSQMRQFLFYFLKTNEFLKLTYSDGFQIGQNSNIRPLYRSSDLPEFKQTVLNHVNSLRPERPMALSDFKSMDYTVHNGGQDGDSNFIARQIQYLQDTGLPLGPLSRNKYRAQPLSTSAEPTAFSPRLDSISFLQNAAVACFNQGIQARDSLIHLRRIGSGPRADALEGIACSYFTRAQALNALLPDTLQLWYVRDAARGCEIPGQALIIQDFALRGQMMDAATRDYLPKTAYEQAVITAKGLPPGYLLSKGQFRVDVPSGWSSPVTLAVTVPGYMPTTVVVPPQDFDKAVVVPLTARPKCYETLRAEGIALMGEKKYEAASAKFTAAAQCPDVPAQGNDLPGLLEQAGKLAFEEQRRIESEKAALATEIQRVREGADDDNDGIPNKDDECPTEKGTLETRGCPQPRNQSSAKEVGEMVEDFRLKNVDGNMVSLSDYKNVKGFIVIFTSNHCPYSQLYERRIIELHKKYSALGFPVVAINPNSPIVVPEDSYEEMQKRARQKRYPFAYLFDENQTVYPGFGASRTPHTFVLDFTGLIRYIGAIDDNPENPNDVKERLVENAVNALLANQSPDPDFTRTAGCTIKRKPDKTGANPRDLSVTLAEIEKNMVPVPGGTFSMGCDEKREAPCQDDEKPLHTVRLDGFSISKYEVTQSQWRAVMGSNPPQLHNTGCDNCPVERVSWNDVQEFLKKLNSLITNGKKYRLPTEAEWEYAARGGQKSQNYQYSGSNEAHEVAWCRTNHEVGNTFGSQKSTRPVGTKKANELGLYDMSGNVWEWCSDWYDAKFYANKKEASDNPKGPKKGSSRVVRGGSWDVNGWEVRAAIRLSYDPYSRYLNLGCRLARD